MVLASPMLLSVMVLWIIILLAVFRLSLASDKDRSGSDTCTIHIIYALHLRG
jgi:hypothetical protein